MENPFIIIAFYNGINFIKPCLESLAKCSGNFKVIIVDNSTIETGVDELVKNYSFSSIVKTQPGIGFAKANNFGTKIAIDQGASHIVILNQDTIVENDFVEKLLKPFDNDPSLAIVAPLLYDYNFETIESFFVKWYLAQNPAIIKDAFENDLKSQYYLEKISGACFAIRVDVIKRIGLFDPIYHMYSEDEDLCRKLKHNGYQIGLNPHLRISHFHFNTNPDPDTITRKMLWQRESLAIFALKDPGNGLFFNIFRLVKNNLLSYFNMFLAGKLGMLWQSFKTDCIVFSKLSLVRRSRLRDAAKEVVW
jgi:GT2 family glycosyltransferase